MYSSRCATWVAGRFVRAHASFVLVASIAAGSVPLLRPMCLHWRSRFVSSCSSFPNEHGVFGGRQLHSAPFGRKPVEWFSVISFVGRYPCFAGFGFPTFWLPGGRAHLGANVCNSREFPRPIFFLGVVWCPGTCKSARSASPGSQFSVPRKILASMPRCGLVDAFE